MSDNFLSKVLGIKMRAFNPNPSQEVESMEDLSDCSVRAICGLTGFSWEEVYKGLFHAGLKKHRMMDTGRSEQIYLAEYGYVNIAHYLDDIETVAEFLYTYKEGEYIVGCDGHVFYYADGTIYDNAYCIARFESLYTNVVNIVFVSVDNPKFRKEIDKALYAIETIKDAEAYHADKLRAMYENAIKREEI
jgi:hypothetical protein